MKFEWENIWESEEHPNLKIDNCWEATYRAKVPGGWLIRYQTIYDKKIQSEEEECAEGWETIKNNLTFIPDPNHEWKIFNISNDILNMKIENMDFKYTRTKNRLRAEGIDTIEDLLKFNAYSLMKIPNLGKKSLLDIRDTLSKYNLKIEKMD